MKKSLLALCLLALLCVAGGKRGRHVVSFHLEADPKTDHPKMIFEYPVDSGVFYRKSPAIYWKQVKGHRPFAGDDGNWGSVLRLSKGGGAALSATSNGTQGRKILSMVQGTPRYVLKIDKMVQDGHIVIWEALYDVDIALFDKKFGRF